jgi:hypothetical protein
LSDLENIGNNDISKINILENYNFLNLKLEYNIFLIFSDLKTLIKKITQELNNSLKINDNFEEIVQKKNENSILIFLHTLKYYFFLIEEGAFISGFEYLEKILKNEGYSMIHGIIQYNNIDKIKNIFQKAKILNQKIEKEKLDKHPMLKYTKDIIFNDIKNFHNILIVLKSKFMIELLSNVLNQTKIIINVLEKYDECKKDFICYSCNGEANKSFLKVE